MFHESESWSYDVWVLYVLEYRGTTLVLSRSISCLVSSTGQCSVIQEEVLCGLSMWYLSSNHTYVYRMWLKYFMRSSTHKAVLKVRLWESHMCILIGQSQWGWSMNDHWCILIYIKVIFVRVNSEFISRVVRMWKMSVILVDNDTQWSSDYLVSRYNQGHRNWYQVP